MLNLFIMTDSRGAFVRNQKEFSPIHLSGENQYDHDLLPARTLSQLDNKLLQNDLQLLSVTSNHQVVHQMEHQPLDVNGPTLPLSESSSLTQCFSQSQPTTQDFSGNATVSQNRKMHAGKFKFFQLIFDVIFFKNFLVNFCIVAKL